VTPESAPRIAPVAPPYAPEVAQLLGDMMLPKPMRGQQIYDDFAKQEPLKFMRTWVHHLPLTRIFQDVRDWVHSDSVLPARERELIALRVCALTGFEVEWGIRVFAYGTKVGLTESTIEATATCAAGDPVWSQQDSAVIGLVDELHASGGVTDPTWRRVAERWSVPELLELLFFAGWYHTIAYIGNGVRVEGEHWAAPYPAPGKRPPSAAKAQLA
jgi:4-carboxymuconolactone decarboxylase